MKGAKKKAASAAPKKASKASKASKREPVDDGDESLSDSGSEIGWDSDEDQFITSSAPRSRESRYAEEDDLDDDCDGGILLSDLLDQNMKKKGKAAKAEKKPTKEDKKKKKVTIEESDPEEEEAEEVENAVVREEDEQEEEQEIAVNEEGEEEMDMDSDEDVEEEVENDDEEEQGEGEEHDGNAEEDEEEDNGSDVDEDEDEDSDSEEEEDSDEEDRHMRLVSSIVGKFAAKSALGADAQTKFHNQLAPEQATMSFDENLSLGALLGELQDAQGLEAVKSTLDELEKKKGVPKYVEKVIATRLERKELYQTSKADMNKWHETVLANRHASQLDLANDKRHVTRAKDLVTKFKPENDMEKEIQMVLVESGATDEAAEQKEVEMLQARNMSMQEIKQRQAELAKVNALMFYEQMKRHRVNKIKSKAYRTIRRKQKRREKAEAGEGEEDVEMDADESAALDEKNAFDRVKERMDLKHKNTSKWAKMALAHGHTDKSLRDAYHESVRLGHELTKKMNERVGGDDEEDDDAFDGEGGDISEAVKGEFKKLFDEENASKDMLVDGKYKKLFEMDFMKKATDQQKMRAREEAQQILKEIESMEAGADSDDDHVDDVLLQGKTFSAEEKKAAKDTIKSLFRRNEGGGFQLHFSQLPTQISSAASNVPTKVDTQNASAETESAPAAGKKKKNKAAKKESEASAPAEEAPSNPWLAVGAASGNSAGKKRGAKQLGVKAKEAEEAPQVLVSIPNANSSSDKPVATKKNSSQPTESEVEKKVLSNKTQAELVEMAFAAPDFEADFLQHKQQEIDRELGVDEKKMKILKDVKAGWGDWAGPGGMEVSQKIQNKRDRLVMQVQKENETKRLERKDAKMSNVMISERRISSASKYKIAEVPYPFKSREEYERSLQMPLGEEWNASQAVNKLTQPEIKKRSGRIIEPIKLPKRQTSANAAATTSNKKQKTK